MDALITYAHAVATFGAVLVGLALLYSVVQHR